MKFHRVRSPLLAILATASTLAMPTPARSGWGTEPVTVRSSTAWIPIVSACNDGGYGTFVAWQEEATAGTGEVRIQHLLPTGDLDPAWPSDGALASSAVATRTRIGAIPDHLGGVFVWWREPGPSGDQLYVNRVDGAGAVASGWPSIGRLIAITDPSSSAPHVIEDGANGFYAIWIAPSATADPTVVKAIHLGPDNAGAGGWTNAPKAIGVADPIATWDKWPQLALAPDGGVFAAWASWSEDPLTLPSAFRFRRLTSAGLNAPGWLMPGITIAPFHAEWLAGVSQTDASLLAIAPDGRGGVFALIGDPTEAGDPPPLQTLLFRLQGDGQSAADWPAGGRTPPGSPFAYWLQQEPGSFRAYADGQDGALIAIPEFYTDSPAVLGLRRATAAGQWSGGGQGNALGMEIVAKGDGELYLATFNRDGPSHPFDQPAFLVVEQTLTDPDWTALHEYHSEVSLLWYGDIGLASCGARQAVFFWSQVRERFGLFARRFSAAGEVTGVAPTAGHLALRGLRFVTGVGVVVRADLDGAPARLELFDLTGRRLAARDLESAGPGDVTIPGTAAIPSGLYFARIASATGSALGRVVVAR